MRRLALPSGHPGLERAVDSGHARTSGAAVGV